MKRKKVYNLFQIYLILFYTASFFIVPIILVISYIFDLHLITSENSIIFLADIFGFIFFVAGSIILVVFRRDFLERKLKPTYQLEFSLLITIVTFGVLGINILYLYLGGPVDNVPHIMIPLFIFSYLVLFKVGDKYFNVDYLKR
ncbi:MAG: hypothetical protein QM489_01500 [Candidatus Izemoplasma sp.]